MTQPSSLAQRLISPLKDKVEEKDEGRKSPVVDPAFLERIKRKAPQVSGKDVFLIASFADIILELSAALFTLSVIHFQLSKGTVHKVTLGYYAALACLVSILMVDSMVSLGEANDDWKQGRISRKELLLKKTEYIATIAASVMWISLCVASVIMESGYSWDALVMFSLCVSVIAPLTGMFSAFVRAYEAVVSSREQEKRQALANTATAESSDAEGSNRCTDAARLSGTTGSRDEAVEEDKEHASSKPVVAGSEKSSSLRKKVALFLRSSMFIFIAVFEAAHCLCHVYEAYLLVGNTHQLFFITQEALLYTQAALAVVFLIAFIAEHVIKEGQDAQKEDSLDAISCKSACAESDSNLGPAGSTAHCGGGAAIRAVSAQVEREACPAESVVDQAPVVRSAVTHVLASAGVCTEAQRVA
ncbi:hypothetical protein [Candidatus Anaplasma sp. TIGMIC]|uniref:hypothetical protein n=1 Tax=Candidatus Anaplasma sp. TIGMIC TaxID=3020713 RepID=UPI00232C752A|nr:hypothetical protein [Candidatus Anaplasma sp. TIGMIC]MDB1135051.1 hypothetical protein [Candidatus Anaplasma sp. TIGMIC]